MPPWPPTLSPNATWSDVVQLQLRPWSARGFIDVGQFLRDTNNLRGLSHPPNAALVDTDSWRVRQLGARWVGHHTTRAQAVLNLFRLAQSRARSAGRPLPPITFVIIVSDGHGATASGFNASSCTCKSEASCCDPKIDAPLEMAPAAPSFATLFCRHTYDISVPTIIDDLLDTRSADSIERSVQKWLAMGDARPWATRTPKAFFVGDDKAYRPAVLRHGRAHPEVLSAHHAVSTDVAHRLPFAEHAKYKAAVYAHGFHFNSVRWRRLTLLGGAVLAAEGPCKEWWQTLAQRGIHYQPTTETFSDLVDAAERLLDPQADGRARGMAAALRVLGLRAFRADGLLDYIETLWRAYAALQRPFRFPPQGQTSSAPLRSVTKRSTSGRRIFTP